MITLVLVDEQPVVRYAVRCLLEEEADLKVIGETGDGLEAASLVQQLNPDVVVMELALPGMNGMELTRQIAEKESHPRILIFTRRMAQASVVEALKHGATGYCLKCCPVTDLMQAIRNVASDMCYLSPPLSSEIIRAFVRIADSATDPYETLSTREREVLHLAAEGCSNGTIGERLFISPRTVEHHRASIMQKLGFQSQTDLIRFALRRGLIPMDD